MLNPHSRFVSPTIMERIPQKGDIVLLGNKQFAITSVVDGKIHSAKRLQTFIVTFHPMDDVRDRQKIIRDSMKDRLPIELISAVLYIDGMSADYGLDEDLLKAEKIIITYTK